MIILLLEWKKILIKEITIRIKANENIVEVWDSPLAKSKGTTRSKKEEWKDY